MRLPLHPPWTASLYICLSVCVFVCLRFCLSVCPSFCLSFYPYVHLYVYASVYLSVCVSVCVCLSVRPMGYSTAFLHVVICTHFFVICLPFRQALIFCIVLYCAVLYCTVLIEGESMGGIRRVRTGSFVPPYASPLLP